MPFQFKISTLLLFVMLFLSQCGTNDPKEEFHVEYGFKFSIQKGENETTVKVIERDSLDYLKYGVLSEVIVQQIEKPSKVVFYFMAKDNRRDSLVYSKEEVINIQKTFLDQPCMLKSCKRILSNLSNEKIKFYDSVLYSIMLYDSKLHGVDTAYYAKSDVSIVSILYNRCRYDINDPPKKYKTQTKYLQVIPIWCENRALFPLYDEKDLW